MKIQASLLAAAGVVSAGMHGYNNCYLATSIGIENLKTSPVGLHIDSVWRKDFDGISERNTFSGGHLHLRDKYSIVTQSFAHSGDTLTTGSGDSFERYVLDGDRIVSQSNGQGMGASISYGDGIITRVDSISGEAKYTTRDTFRGDSLLSEQEMSMLAGMWFPSRSCKATDSTCDCDEDGDPLVWKFKPGSIEESKNGSLEAIYYTSEGTNSVRSRIPSARKAPEGSWRADGTRVRDLGAWMPTYSVPGR